MLIGYDPKTGEIKFTFTDDKYLKSQFPKNTAKISNFWRCKHELKELFTSMSPENIKYCKVVNGKLVKKSKEELVKKNNLPVMSSALESLNSSNKIEIKDSSVKGKSVMRTLGKYVIVFYFIFNYSMSFADMPKNRTLGNPNQYNKAQNASSQEDKKRDNVDVSVDIDNRYELNKTIAVDVKSSGDDTKILIFKHFKF